MRRFALVTLMLLIAGIPLFASTRKDVYEMPCSALWPAVRITVRNSGEYAVVFLDSTEMIASFAIGGGQQFRIGSAVLDAKGDACEMQVETHQPGALTDDVGSFKKRVDKALAEIQSAKPTTPAPAKTGPGNK